MRILIIMGGFFPGEKYGGPPVSVDNFCSLMDDYECYIVTKNHDMGEQMPYVGLREGWNDRKNCKVLYLEDRDYGKSSFEKVILQINPDILYLQGIFQNSIIPSLQLAQKYQIKVVLAPRGELCTGAFNIKKYKKLPYISFLRITGLTKNVFLQYTSEEETEAIHKKLRIPLKKIFYLSNIPSVPSQDYIRIEKKKGSANFIFLSRIHPKKNLLGAIEYFNNISGDVIFDIYGPIEDKAYWEECKSACKMLPPSVKVSYKGLAPHDCVHQIFSQYHAFIFPTYSENFGHVIAEALMVGCPVIISNQTPWNDINDTVAGWAISLKNKDMFISAIQEIIDSDRDKMLIRTLQAKLYVREKLKINEIKRNYMQVFANN